MRAVPSTALPRAAALTAPHRSLLNAGQHRMLAAIDYYAGAAYAGRVTA